MRSYDFRTGKGRENSVIRWRYSNSKCVEMFMYHFAHKFSIQPKTSYTIVTIHSSSSKYDIRYAHLHRMLGGAAINGDCGKDSASYCCCSRSSDVRSGAVRIVSFST